MGENLEITSKDYLSLCSHTLCVINSDTDKVLTFTFTNEPAYFTEALSNILKVTKTKDIIFGLEDTMSFGLHFSYYLTKMGFIVKAVNPALANAYRSTLRNYHKSDEYDSFCCAKVLKDEYKHLPDFHHELIYSNMKLVVGLRAIITRQQGTNFNLLHQQLAKVYPGYTKFFTDIQMRGALALYAHFPSPRFLKGYSAEELAKEMRQYVKMFTVVRSQKILDIVRSNPVPFVDEIVEATIVDLIKDIYLKEEKLAKLTEQLDGLIKKTGYQLETMPGISTTLAAKLISEIGDINRFKNHNQLAKYAAIGPTSVGSGEHNKELVSRGGNRWLRSTFYMLAVGLISYDKYGNNRNDVLRAYYLGKREKGKTKSQALVSVMRQLVKIIYYMMKNKSEYRVPAKLETKKKPK